MKRICSGTLALAAIMFFAPARLALAGPDDHGGGHGGEAEVEFTGTIQSLPPGGLIGDWRVSDRIVHVSAATKLEAEEGTFAVGATVKVEGQARSDGSVDAEEIELREAEDGDDDDDDDDNQVEFKGTIQSLPSTVGFIGDWVVGGKTIHVSASTKIEAEHGPVMVGAFVEIHGTPRADGSIDASKIEVESNPQGDDGRVELQGTIQHLPTSGLIGDWIVSGKTVHVTSSTKIDLEHGMPAVGDTVEVKGTLQPDGSITAIRIEVESEHGDEGEHTGFKGSIQSLPPSGLMGDWMVSGRMVHVVSSTKLKGGHGSFAVGTRVKVNGLLMADGSTGATKIKVKN